MCLAFECTGGPQTLLRGYSDSGRSLLKSKRLQHYARSFGALLAASWRQVYTSLHKYAVSGHRTPFDTIKDPYWEAVENFAPGCVHPNGLMVSSCTAAIIGCCLLLGFCPYLSVSPPCWVFLISAIPFLFQTLDAIDGKHARCWAYPLL